MGNAVSQFQVAREFGFPVEQIRRLLVNKKYNTASDLIDDLEKLDEQVVKDEIVDEKEDVLSTEKVIESDLKLRQETEKLYRNTKCLVCYVNTRSRLCLPCCHLTHCESCERKVKVCPRMSCRENIEWTIQTYF